MGQANVFRGIFFVMTFFSIGVVSNFRKLWEEGIGKLAAVYVLCLFGYIIWIGLGHFVDLLPWHAAAVNEGVIYGNSDKSLCSSRGLRKKSARWNVNRSTASRRS